MQSLSLSSHVIEAGAFSFLKGMLTEQSLAAFGSLLMILLGYVVKQELLPLLKARRNMEIARHVFLIADDVTDYFRLKFPSAHWSVWLDRAVDRVMEITGTGKSAANRAVQASLARKRDNRTNEIKTE